MPMLPSGLSEYISDEKPLARFLNSSRLFNAHGLIKQSAFLPRNGETSVFRQGLDPEEELWAIGEQIVQKDRRVHGVAMLQAADIRMTTLEVEAHEPPPRHANIIAWPEGDDALMTKSLQKNLAIQLAQSAELRRKL